VDLRVALLEEVAYVTSPINVRRFPERLHNGW
jgi:hypothetical protein